MTAISKYNPLYSLYEEKILTSCDNILETQNLQYGLDKWYPLLSENTPLTYILELEDIDLKTLDTGIAPDNKYFKNLVEFLIFVGYKFIKTAHASAHSNKAINNWSDFVEQITNPRIIFNLRRYKTKFIAFREWQLMNLECRCYVYDKKIRYIEVYKDNKQEFKPYMFIDINHYVHNIIIPKLEGTYKDFVVDVYLTTNAKNWSVVEINSPLWLKCGTYLINYEWEADRIHNTTYPICRYPDGDELLLDPDTIKDLSV
jgi:hypothetical protein